MKNAFLIVYSRRKSFDYSHTSKAIARIGETLQLDESVWVVRTERELPYVWDFMSMQAGDIDLMFVTQLERGRYNLNVFATDKGADQVLADWLA